ncbi:putative alkaline shock family protein YloU [Sporomusaceae bacterium BoRhaA]|uniref:alkaline shock response membrane anchor protein AmaP n=1 Tax=Pelorhabdus rhamnosifermentans TaxID=2772457 RepID=UPI001C06035F|nr:alkaline shock response membrane anchor protein AmaP [Pelorhabdus rhamnosifermentans]MBU2700938.1 putative alkaline shock family protein YloU [Pelorhabdus rhamnosifermentans]
MKIIDLVILSIYTFLLTFLGLGVVLLAFNLLPLEWVWTSITYLVGQWEVGLIGLLFMLISLRLFLASLRFRKNHETIITHTDQGDIHITVTAIENFVEKTARYTRGVRAVKVNVQKKGNVLKVIVKAVVSPESHVPTVGSEMQKRIAEMMKNTVGVELSDIEILVENISNEFKAKQRVE